MNIAVLNVQVPFVRGGAEVLAEGLVAALERAGHRATLVTAPFRWYPVGETLTAALTWRLFDLTEANGVSIDRVICTKYPTWAVRHPNKVAWIMHQHRQAYDWYGSVMSEFTTTAEDRAVRQAIRDVDRIGLDDCRRVYAISDNVAQRLQWFCGLTATVLEPPTTLAGLRCETLGDRMLSVARLDRAKRVDLLIDALAKTRRPVRAAIVGTGNEEAALRQRVDSLGLGERVRFYGRLSDGELVSLYNTCRAVVYAPIDEDYGYATLEAMLAGKPVLTATDSGGTLGFVIDGVTGAVRPPDPAAFAGVLDDWDADIDACARLGAAGRQRVEGITWETVVAELTRE
ncbi:MAG: glycosyltransferase family 4 protein [Chloroflexi bacterium]|nr:glycosyltransferase family 4 protein [Chloroflexota bacterium]